MLEQLGGRRPFHRHTSLLLDRHPPGAIGCLHRFTYVARPPCRFLE